MTNQTSFFGVTDPHDAGVLRRIKVPTDIEVTAEINGCYRPKLKHTWGNGSRFALFCLTNPSDARIDFTDMTVSKCGRLARRWGFDGLTIGNSCDYRHKTPLALLRVEKPCSDRNIPAILEMAAEASLIVIGHGRLPGFLQEHATRMVNALRAAGHTLHVLRLLEDGTPIHPLARGRGHVPENTQPVVWRTN